MPRLVAVAPVFNWKPIVQVVVRQFEMLNVGLAENAGTVAGTLTVTGGAVRGGAVTGGADGGGGESTSVVEEIETSGGSVARVVKTGSEGLYRKILCRIFRCKKIYGRCSGSLSKTGVC